MYDREYLDVIHDFFAVGQRQKECGESYKRIYIKGKIGICGGVAGNHTQAYGMKEL